MIFLQPILILNYDARSLPEINCTGHRRCGPCGTISRTNIERAGATAQFRDLLCS